MKQLGVRFDGAKRDYPAADLAESAGTHLHSHETRSGDRDCVFRYGGVAKEWIPHVFLVAQASLC